MLENCKFKNSRKPFIYGALGTKNGELSSSSGGRVISGDGLLTILTFPSAFGETDIGWYDPGVEGHLLKQGLHIVANIPPNFVILKATILLSHIPCRSVLYTP